MKRELRILLALALPVIGGQLGQMLLGVVDTVMLGRYGVTELAAATLGSQWVAFTLLTALGVVSGIDPIVAQRHGANDGDGVAQALHQGLFIACGLSVAVGGAWLLTEDFLLLLGQDPKLAALAHKYTLWQLPSIAPFLMWVALRSYLQGRGIVRPAMWVMVPVNLLNILFNWVLIFGHLGVPELGLTGAALATGLSRGVGAVLLLVWVVQAQLHHGAWRRPRWADFAWSALSRPLHLGLSIGAQMGLEIGAFTLTAIVAGHLGETALAAHAIVVSLASFMFMMPLGVALGATTRVGNLVGAGEMRRLNTALGAAFVLGAAAVVINASTFVFFGESLAALFTRAPDVRAVATGAFVVCAAFQLSDSAQVVSSGALRGLGRTRPPAVATFVGYYVFGLPFGYWLGTAQGLGLSGLWWGLALGLTVVATGLTGWLVWLVRRGNIRPLTPGTSS